MADGMGRVLGKTDSDCEINQNSHDETQGLHAS
jgi:hypothetical protein